MSAARPQAIVVGASAGAVQALSVILSRLPANYSLPVLVVVHVPEGPSGLLPLFANKSAIAFREPEDKEPIAPATVYIAPPGYHMLVEAGLSIALSTDEPVLFSRPSIDVLFESAADSYGSGLTGIVLTGDISKGVLSEIEQVECTVLSKPVAPSGHDGLQAQKLADAATESWQTGKPVKVA